MEDGKIGRLRICVLHFPRNWHGRDLEIAPTKGKGWEDCYRSGISIALTIRSVDPTTLLKSLQEGIVPLFGAYSGLRSVAGVDNRVVVQRQELVSD